MADSVHTARWISQLSDTGWDVHLFPCEDGGIHTAFQRVTIHPLLRQFSPQMDVTVQQTGIVWPFRRGRSRIATLIRRRISRAEMLSGWIRRLNPDLVHTLEMQRAGYLTVDARRKMNGGFPPWIFSSWGNDIYHFSRQPEHEGRIRDVLLACDYFVADCARDLGLAREFGFTGCDLGVFPGGGGFDIPRMQAFAEGRPSERRVVAVKGYQSEMWGGRAVVALHSLKLSADALKDYEVVVYSAHGSAQVSAAVRQLVDAGVRVSTLPKSSHDEMVRLMGRARIALALSTTDGTPNTMLEAMIMGAFPVQSDTVSTPEWIVDGRNGLLVSPEDPDYASKAIRRALSDDQLVDQAAVVNHDLTKSEVDVSVVKPRVIQMYEQVASFRRAISCYQGGLCAS